MASLLLAGGMVGLFFFEDAEEKAITVNGERYRGMITDFLWPQLDHIDAEPLGFQQDEATAHTSRQTIALMHEKFQDRIISKNSYVNWPPRSCDLTPLDYFICGFLKGKVYENARRAIQNLKLNIRTEIAAIDPMILEKVIEHFGGRMLACKRSRGGHITDVIFNS